MRLLTLFIVVVTLFVLYSEAKRKHKEEVSISLTPGRRNGLIKNFLKYHQKLYHPETKRWSQFAVLCIVPEKGDYDYDELYNLYLCAHARPDRTDNSIHAEDNVFTHLQDLLNYFNNNKEFQGQKFDILLYTYLLPCGRCKDTIVNQVVGKGAREIAVVYSVIYPFADQDEGNKNLNAVTDLFTQNGINLYKHPTTRQRNSVK